MFMDFRKLKYSKLLQKKIDDIEYMYISLCFSFFSLSLIKLKLTNKGTRELMENNNIFFYI